MHALIVKCRMGLGKTVFNGSILRWIILGTAYIYIHRGASDSMVFFSNKVARARSIET